MVPMNVKVALKYASMKHGELFVTISGTTMMHRLCAISWDTPDKVEIPLLQLIGNSLTNLLQVPLLEAEPTLVKEMDRFKLIMLCAVEVKLVYRTVHYLEPITVRIARMQVLSA